MLTIIPGEIPGLHVPESQNYLRPVRIKPTKNGLQIITSIELPHLKTYKLY